MHIISQNLTRSQDKSALSLGTIRIHKLLTTYHSGLTDPDTHSHRYAYAYSVPLFNEYDQYQTRRRTEYSSQDHTVIITHLEDLYEYTYVHIPHWGSNM